jgi:hypothetical protein
VIAIWQDEPRNSSRMVGQRRFKIVQLHIQFYIPI